MVGALPDTLLACTLTPRTHSVDCHEVVYEEAKLCMSSGDVDRALALFHRLPDTFRHTDRYVSQCLLYDTLCRDGALTRRGTDSVRRCLCLILGEDYDSSTIVRYSDALARNGFNEQCLVSTTLLTVDEPIRAAKMSDGHRQLFSRVCRLQHPRRVSGMVAPAGVSGTLRSHPLVPTAYYYEIVGPDGAFPPKCLHE